MSATPVTNQYGVYITKVTYGNGVVKPSTMYPKNYTPDDVVISGQTAASGGITEKLINNKLEKIGYDQNGYEIILRFNESGKVSSWFPNILQK